MAQKPELGELTPGIPDTSDGLSFKQGVYDYAHRHLGTDHRSTSVFRWTRWGCGGCSRTPRRMAGLASCEGDRWFKTFQDPKHLKKQVKICLWVLERELDPTSGHFRPMLTLVHSCSGFPPVHRVASSLRSQRSGLDRPTWSR